MANPNFLEASSEKVSMKLGTYYYATPAGRTGVAQVTSPIASGEVGKITSLLVTGKHNTDDGYYLVSITLQDNTGSGGTFHIIKKLPVYDGTTVSLVDRENPIYLPETYRVLTRAYAPDGTDVPSSGSDDNLPNVTCAVERYYVS